MYLELVSRDNFREYLAIKGVLAKVAVLITDEIEELNKLEEHTLSTDLAQGYFNKYKGQKSRLFTLIRRILDSLSNL